MQNSLLNYMNDKHQKGDSNTKKKFYIYQGSKTECITTKENMFYVGILSLIEYHNFNAW